MTEKADLEMIEQMRTMEIMKKDSGVVPAQSDLVTSEGEVEVVEVEEGEVEEVEVFFYLTYSYFRRSITSMGGWH